MKPTKSKQQQRHELDTLVEQYLQQGGDVSQHELGESGRDANKPLPKSPFVEQGDQSRTLVNEVVQAIEERKYSHKKKPTKPTFKRAAKKQLLVDDFGEPLRWVWSDRN